MSNVELGFIGAILVVIAGIIGLVIAYRDLTGEGGEPVIFIP
ncbi:hypothetical protein [Aneurinibacillus terranovensis]|nr:hypothetical protein [Aneurinibacillus terranovensis]